MITAEEARKITKMFSIPEEIEVGIKETAKAGGDFYVYCTNNKFKRLTNAHLLALTGLGYEVNTKIYPLGAVDYIISWKND